MDPRDSVEIIKGVGPALAQKLHALGIKSVDDLLQNYPRRYDDYSDIKTISNIKPGPVSIQAVIKQVTGRYVRRGMHITEAVASDSSGSVRLIWFNQPYRAASLKTDTAYFISGVFELRHQKLSIMNPSLELASDFPVNTARIVPIYRESNGVNSTQIRKLLREVFKSKTPIPETLPEQIIKDQTLVSRKDALFYMHFPANVDDVDNAKRRLGFEEVFQLSVAALLNKQANQADSALEVPFNKELAQSFVGHLPFTLTDDQRKVIWKIYQDIAKPQPMNRLVEGDVGSGKTVVAAMAALMAMEQGFQVALMAPTELLARQHAETLHRMLEPLGYGHQVSLLVGSMKAAQKRTVHAQLKNGNVRFIVGTHALIQEKVDMHRLGLVIIDEQHRFGVAQRKTLQAKAGHAVHILSMTATPIPRSLALTLYGELDISIISAKPADRLPIITNICSPNSVKALYEEVDAMIGEGRQLFVVCPLVTESTVSDAKSVEKVYESLRLGAFKHRRVGLLHGKLKAEEKTHIMSLFAKHELDVLVATTVIEVGVDVPNATMMIIEDADRFGLAQLHQLRGRVGRSHHQGYCYLVTSDSKAPSRRLRALASSNDGFKLAELDLELRGPGAIYGSMQHGQLDLRVAKLSDTKLIAAARNEAQAFIDSKENLLHYTYLAEHVEKLRAVTNLN